MDQTERISSEVLVHENLELRAKLRAAERSLEDLELELFSLKEDIAKAEKNEALALYERDQALDAVASLDTALEKAVKRLIDTGRF